MTLWDWLTTTTSGDGLFTTLGLGTFLVLFATNRILTIGQHRGRVADIVAHHQREMAAKDAAHTRELAEKDARIAEKDASREGWRDVALKERELRDTATNGVASAATAALVDVKHVLESLDEALDGPDGRRHD